MVEIHGMCLEIDKQFKLLGVRRAEMHSTKPKMKSRMQTDFEQAGDMVRS